MIYFAVACAVFAILFCVAAVVSERWTPLVGVGGLLLLFAIGQMVFGHP